MPHTAAGESPNPESTAQVTGPDPADQDANAAASSAAGQDPAPDAGASPSDANAAESSAAEKPDAKKPDLASVIRDAVAPKAKKGEEESSASEAGGKPESAEAKDDGQKKADADAKDEDADVPQEFHKHPAWRRLKSQRDDARKELETLTGRVEKLEAPAEQYGKIVGFMQRNGLTAEEAANGFTIMALIKQDPQKALEALRPLVGRLERTLGEVLPDDLRQEVEAGTISEERALELSRARARSALSERRVQTVTQEVEKARETSETSRVNDLRRAMARAVSDWELNIRKTDADYAAKEALVHDRIRAVAQDPKRIPRSVDDAVALAKEAYEYVNERVSAFRPKPRPHSPMPTGASPASVTAKPKTLREAIELGLRQAG